MTHDDEHVGHLLSRREVLELLGAAGTTWLTAGATSSTAGATLSSTAALNPASARTPSCVVRPEQTDGPYFVDARLNRSDIRSDPSGDHLKAGVPLALTLLVSRLSDASCQPLEGAHVDIWQCDARGIYSGARDRNFDTIGQTFLRGFQVTDAGGEARFVTVYPGWYPGRAVHIHFKIRTDPASSRGYEFTSQLYFDDALTDRLHTTEPYAEGGQRRTRNRDDGIFRRGGEQLMLDPVEADDGYAAPFAIGLQLP